ncbi:MAG: STAS domain-containing protein [Lachnospiraceae bacterium]|nr:STAS domain-containing protein [Lachnospiraceae bacterium]
MKITKNQNGNSLCLALEGRLDTNTAPELENTIKGAIEGVEELTIDMADLDYLSSAGLRVLLGAQKIMNKQGSMRVIHVNDTIMEIFEVTGFADILTIEKA